MSGAYSTDEYEELEVEIIREAWNTYDLEDGTRIKARPVLTKLYWPQGVEVDVGESVDVKLGAKITNLVVVFDAPERLRGPPDPNPPAIQKAMKLPREEVPIVDSNEEWNIYGIGEGRAVKLKMVVTSIFRVAETYNEDGEPYYFVNSSPVLGPTTPPEDIPP